MTGPTSGPLPDLVDAGQHRRRGTVRRKALAAIVLAVALGVGSAIGMASCGDAGALAAASQVSALRGQVTSLKGQVTSLNNAVTSWQSHARQATATARHATAAAYAAASAAYAARDASLWQQQAAMKEQEKAVVAVMGQLRASQISGDGVYVVGKDIKPGIYHTNGSSDKGQSNCYFATLKSTKITDNTEDNDFDGAETVDVSSAYAFQVSGPCTWVRVG